MKKVIAILLSIMLLASCAAVLAGCGTKEKPKDSGFTGSEVGGGWNKAESPALTDAFKAVFDKATSTLSGVQYVPVAYLASQVVAGTNHCVLCKAAATVPDAEETYAIVYIYEDLNGGAEITEVMTCDVPANSSEDDGGWQAPETPAVPEEALAALTKACATLAGEEYTPVALLATQVVSGVNYRLLCEARASVPGAEARYVILTVNADPQGGASLAGTAEFVSDQNAQIANPREEYGSSMESLEAAEEAVGFSLTLPEDITPENFVVISGEILEVDFDGGYIRKALGSDDISGDYNEYAVNETKTADGKEITLKGSGSKIMLALWTDGGYTYCVGVADGAKEADILAMAGAVK